MNMLISRQDLIDLLNKSFEEGYSGYLEMKEDCVNLILESYINKNKNIQYSSTSNITLQYPYIGSEPPVSITSTYSDSVGYVSTEFSNQIQTVENNERQINLSLNY